MIYRCAECHRSLIKPAYTAPDSMGGWVLGRVCAKRTGKIEAKRKGRKKTMAKVIHPGQFDMFAILEQQYLIELAAAPIADEDDPLAAVPIIQRLVSAAQAAPITAIGPCSVFDLWRAPVTLTKTRPEAVQHITRIERADGAVRCIRILPQETPEWQIKEAARRARQTPPKPTQKAKTMSSKMATMLGMEPIESRYEARVSVALQKQATPSKIEQARAEREQRQRPARARREKD